MHENAARALQYYEELPLRSGRPELRLVDSEPRTRRRLEADESAPAIAERPAPAHGSRTRAGTRAPDRHVPARGDGTRRRAAARGRDRTAAARTQKRPEGQTIALARPRPAAPRLAGRPDRVAMWAVLLGFFLTAVAAATGHG